MRSQRNIAHVKKFLELKMFKFPHENKSIKHDVTENVIGEWHNVCGILRNKVHNLIKSRIETSILSQYDNLHSFFIWRKYVGLFFYDIHILRLTV